MSERGRRRTAQSLRLPRKLATGAAFCIMPWACSRPTPGGPTGSASTSAKSAPAPSAGGGNPSSSSPTPPRAAGTSAGAASPRAEAPAPATTTRVIEEDRADAGLTGLSPGELADVGPAAPASAAREGIVFLTKDDRILLARCTPGTKPESAKLSPVDEPSTAFAPLAKAPSLAAGFAYWVSRGRLVRRSVAGGELELLRDDARFATRTSAAEVGGKAAVAYIGRPDAEGTSHARLWLDGAPPLDLTPDGAGASSVALARHGEGLLAVVIDGRSAMTPVHARRISVERGQTRLEEDVVVWVAGSAQAFTEVFVGSSRGRAFAHLPIERDVTHFGLASVDLGAEPHLDSEVSFFDYPNGIDLAPAATTELCGRPYVAFVRPSNPAPHAPQELVLAEPGGGRALNLANSRGFASVSLAGLPNGGLVSYVADGRTWARGLACR